MPPLVKRCVGDGRQEDVKVFIMMVGMGSSLQDLAGALLVIFKTNSSETGSKVSKGFPTKDSTVVYSA